MARILPIIVLILGVILGIYLVTRPQPSPIQSKADYDISQEFIIKDGNGKQIYCKQDNNGVPVCDITTLNFTVAVNDPQSLVKNN